MKVAIRRGSSAASQNSAERYVSTPVIEIGIRQLVAKELRDTPEPPFSNRYPAYPHVRERDEELALAERVIDQWDGAGGLIHMGLAIETGRQLDAPQRDLGPDHPRRRRASRSAAT